MNVGPEGGRAASFHYKPGRPPKKTSLKGIYSGVNVPRAGTGGSCTWPFGAWIKPSCPLVKGPQVPWSSMNSASGLV